MLHLQMESRVEFVEFVGRNRDEQLEDGLSAGNVAAVVAWHEAENLVRMGGHLSEMLDDRVAQLFDGLG